MFLTLLITFVDLFIMIFNVLLIVRVLSSYFVQPGNRFYGFLMDLTEPVLVPIRHVLPKTPGWDWAPVVAFILLYIIQSLVNQLPV